MAVNPTVYTGEDATLNIKTGGSFRGHSTLAISDFSLTISRDVAEQELVGEAGNYFLAGSMSADGSLGACKLHSTAVGYLLSDMIAGNTVQISGMCGPNSLHFFLHSCQITGFDFSIGPADEITEGTIDYTLLYPYRLSTNSKELGGYTYLREVW